MKFMHRLNIWVAPIIAASIGIFVLLSPVSAQAQQAELPGKLWFAATNVMTDLAPSHAAMATLETGTTETMFRNPITTAGRGGVLVVNNAQIFLNLVVSRTVPVGIRGVVYDNQRSPLTPVPQQQNPMRYDIKVAKAAASLHLFSMCDLIQPARLPASEHSAAYEVPPCTMVGLNAVQQSERSAVTYANVVGRDVMLVHSVYPNTDVIAGLSSNPRGTVVTAAELQQAMNSVAGIVAGYWLNIPEPSISCPNCNVQNPSVLIGALS